MNSSNIEDIYELSPLQQGMLFHVLYEPESRLYFEQILLPLEGFINLEAFRTAWNLVAAANTVLRTSFHWQETEKPVQVVHRACVVPVETHQVGNVPGPARDGQIQSILAADRQRGFDLQRAPLLRIGLLQSTSGSHGLLFSFHHLILDGWSLQTVFGQFSQAYQSLCLGHVPTTLPTRPYGEYIRWLQKQDYKRAGDYWRRTLAGFDRGCRLPTDGHGSGDSETFTELTVELSEEATSKLRSYAARHHLTLNALVQGGWALLISRLTGCSDVTFGVTVSGRPAELPGVEGMVGLFINTVPLRVKVDYSQSCTAWLSNLQTAQFEARQFDYSPLVSIREWTEIPGNEPLFDTLLAFENYPVQMKAIGGSATATFVERTNYSLSAAVVPRNPLQTRLLYNRGVLTPESVAKIGEQFNRLLESLATGNGQLISSLDTLTENDRVLLASLNSTATSTTINTSVTDIWDKQVRLSPTAPAIEFNSQRLTYMELDKAAATLAGELRRAGVNSGVPVGVFLPRSIEFVVGALAILKAGGVYVPIDTAYPIERVRAILDDVAAPLVLTRSDIAESTGTLNTSTLLIDGCLDGLDEEVTEPLPSCNSKSSPAYIIYTSGSTGAPKGITVPHGAIVNLVQDQNFITLRNSDRVGHMSNCGFDAAVFEIWGALLNGATIVGIDQSVALAPPLLAKELRERQVTVLFITTALFNHAVTEVPDIFSSLDVLLFGGELVDPGPVRTVLGEKSPRRFCHVYGPTETTTFATWYQIETLADGATNVPIGRPLTNLAAYVLDPGLSLLPPGSTGELYIGGSGVAQGYHGRPDATAERFLPDPYSDRKGSRMYRTGDKVRWRLDGSIEFLGRFDSQVKLRGYRIELKEIERHLQKHDQVRQAAVVMRTTGGENSLVAYFVPNGHADPHLDQELRSHLRKQFPEYMQPSVISPIAALPLNENGKIDYRALRQLEPVRPNLDAQFVGPRNAIEEKLTSIWQKVLGLDRVGIHDAFFDIGGHSLRATQLVSRIRRELGIELELREVFEKPTIAELAVVLSSQTTEPPASIREIGRVSRDESRRVLS